MADLPEKLTFQAWQRSKLFDSITVGGPRLTGRLDLTLTDSNTGQSAPGTSTYTLLAASDIAGLKPGAVKHMAPAPFARDAETTKLVHVDLREPDLPWRYTPEAPDPQGRVRPWLVLLVGTAEELKVEGGLVTFVDDRVLSTHDLGRSHLWAHTQWDGHTSIARVISPRGLEPGPGGRPGLTPQHEYLAVLVPAFNDAGQSMWTGTTRHFGSRGTLPAFHSWRFWTSEAGDFETLVAALHIPPARDVGKAKLHYRREIPAGAVNIDATLEVRGAITSLQQPETPQQDLLDAVRADLDLLNDEQQNTIGLPQYGRPWLPEPDGFPGGWPRDLNDDPRFRGTTGLGAWMGVEAQEALMDAAVAQAGALREAGQRIGHLALGLLAAGSLWDRRMPTDPHERLRLLGPVMSRMVAADGGIVLDRVTPQDGPLPAAVFSSVAQRILRDRSGPTRHITGAGGGINRAVAMAAANQPEPQPDRAPAGLPHVDAIAQELGLPRIEDIFALDDRRLAEVIRNLSEIARDYAEKYRGELDELIRLGEPNPAPGLQQQLAEPLFGDLGGVVRDFLAENGLPCEWGGILENFEAEFGISLAVHCRPVLADPAAREQLLDWLRTALRHCMARERCGELLANNPENNLSCNDLVDNLPVEPDPERPLVDLGRLSDVVFKALDPRTAVAPARVRLCAQMVGVDCLRLVPPEFPIGLDFPTWGLLKQYDKEWLLPGAGELEKDSVTALQTNPTFVDGFMVGINTQFMSEMRWRDLAVARTCTPLRMFWGQVNYATHQREPDIQPLAEWAAATAEPIGALSHQAIRPHDPDNTGGSRLVLTFRSELFRRYPKTLVYLVRPGAGGNVDALLKSVPALDAPAGLSQADLDTWRANRRHFGPIFVGTLTPELTFFTFDVTPSKLDEYWLVLDEPPAELRFVNNRPPPSTNAAAFADVMLDTPTRVGISGQALEDQGLEQ